MRNSLFLVLSVGLVSALGVGCGDSSSTGTGGGGTGGGGTGGATTTTSVTNSTTTGGPDCTGLTGGTDECSLCIEGSCCVELDACLADADCAACAADSSGAGCDTNALLGALGTCLQDSCATECSPSAAGECARFCCADTDCGTGTCDKTLTGDANVGICVDGTMTAPACDAPATSPSTGSCVTNVGTAPYMCNPITNEGCDSGAGEACDFGQDGFECYPAPNTEAICTACDAANGPFCAAGHSCLPTQ